MLLLLHIFFVRFPELIANDECPIKLGNDLYPCGFAQGVDIAELFHSETEQAKFLKQLTHWEGRFLAEGIGVDCDNALTHYAVDVDILTGLVNEDNIYKRIEPLNEGLHLSLLALALDGNPYAIGFINASMQNDWNGTVEGYIINQLYKKITKYESFNSQYPGFAGFFTAVNEDFEPDELYSNSSYMSMSSSGVFAWGLVATFEALSNNGLRDDLRGRYSNYVDMLASNADLFLCEETCGVDPVFYRAVMVIDVYATPSEENYKQLPDCGRSCYLDTPWLGDDGFYFLYLFANWSSETKEALLRRKRNHTRSKEFETDSGSITVLEAGDSNYIEKLSYLLLPYFDVEIVRRVFLNGERARLIYATMNAIPGLSQYPLLPSFYDTDDDGSLVPMAASYLLLQNTSRQFGLPWVATMLQGAMQTRVGIRSARKAGELFNSVTGS